MFKVLNIPDFCFHIKQTVVSVDKYCIYLPIDSILQQEKELLQALDYQRTLLEEACEACTKEETELYRLEEQINHAQEQVNGFRNCSQSHRTKCVICFEEVQKH